MYLGVCDGMYQMVDRSSEVAFGSIRQSGTRSWNRLMMMRVGELCQVRMAPSVR